MERSETLAAVPIINNPQPYQQSQLTGARVI
jgi:hypothetical protein